MRITPPLLTLALLACGEKEPSDSNPSDDSASDDSATEGEQRATINGVITWGVDFDAEAEAAGHTDCSYARAYVGSEDRSLPWLCPSCELLFHADITLDRGEGDCYAQVTSSAPTPQEWLGYADGAWYRANASALTERGPATFSGGTLSVEQVAEGNAAPLGGTLTFNIVGELDVGTEPGSPVHDASPPESYACGWPKADPAPYEGDYSLAVGEIVPDGVLWDVCEEPVRFHDFAGQYLLIDISAMDCPPCQSAAEAEEDFVQQMAGEGLDTTVLTLLAPSLSDTAGTPTQAQLQRWIDTFEVHSPVLADQSWGLSVAYPALLDDYGYPTFILVTPELEVVDYWTGFSSFQTAAEKIRAHAGQ